MYVTLHELTVGDVLVARSVQSEPKRKAPKLSAVKCTVPEGAIVFALANPDPEVDPAIARQTAAVVATGRSDFPNQINNVLVFPGVFRGLLDAQSRTVNTEMMIAAAKALADVVTEDELNPNYIIPSVFNDKVAGAVAGAVREAAKAAASA